MKPANSEPKKSGYRQDIQRLRGISVILVVLYHSELFFECGYLGVDVFFTISGYVITSLLLRETSKPGGARLGEFYQRRFRRLYPALFSLVVITSICSSIVFSPFGQLQKIGRTAIAALFGFGNIAVSKLTGSYFDSASELNPLLHVWSLGVEEQFYLLYPVILVLTFKLSPLNFRKRLWWVVLTLSTISFLGAEASSALYERHTVSEILFGFYGPIGRVWEFGAGALIAIAPTATTSKKLRIILKSSGVLLITLSSLFFSAGEYSNRFALVPVFGTCLFIISGNFKLIRVVGINKWKLLERVGDLSYSIYLWHWPMISILSVVLGKYGETKILYAGLSIFPAVVSYRIIESPLRSKGITPNLIWKWAAPAATIGLIFLVVISTSAITSRVFSNSIDSDFQGNSRLHAAALRGCHLDVEHESKDPTMCGWNIQSKNVPVYLLGDSNAEHFSEAVILSAEESDRPVYIFTGSSCPLLIGTKLVPPVESNKRSWDHCERYVQRSVDWIEKSEPGLIIIASSDEYWWNESIGIVDSDGDQVFETTEKAALYSESLERTVNFLKPLSTQIVLVQSIPTYSKANWDPNKCSALAIADGMCIGKLKLQEVELLQKSSREALARVSEALDVKVLDLRSRYCNQEYCSTSVEGQNAYRDSSHISVSESSELKTFFEHFFYGP